VVNCKIECQKKQYGTDYYTRNPESHLLCFIRLF
jgi:hypothetical protein